MEIWSNLLYTLIILILDLSSISIIIVKAGGGVCPSDTFHCGNGECIDARFVCDHVIDCQRLIGELDGRDEIDCENQQKREDDNLYCSLSSLSADNKHIIRRIPSRALYRLTDSGYNIVEGRFSDVRIFQSERYIGKCRTTERVLRNGSRVNYVLPYNLKEWKYLNEKDVSIPEEPRLKIYESTYDAYVDMRNEVSFSEFSNASSFEDLYIRLQGLFDDDEAENVKLRRFFGEGYPFVRLYTEVIIGTYELKTPDQLVTHRDLFQPNLARAVQTAELGSANNNYSSLLRLEEPDQYFFQLFRRFGTHYVSGGSFGGVYELLVYRKNCGGSRIPEYLGMEEIGVCSQALLKAILAGPSSFSASSWDIPECVNVTSVLTPKPGPLRYDISAHARVTGGDTRVQKALETSAQLNDLSSVLRQSDFLNWIHSLDENPAPVELRLSPLCDLVLPRSPRHQSNTAKSICQRALSRYLLKDSIDQTSKLTPLGEEDQRWGSYASQWCSTNDKAQEGMCLSTKRSFGSCPFVVASTVVSPAVALGHVTQGVMLCLLSIIHTVFRCF